MFDADRQLGRNRWPLVRLRAGCECEVVLLSRKFFSLSTHWIRSTVPCCGDECRLCEVLPTRGLFYVAVICESRLSLLELGAMSASDFEQHAKLLHSCMTPGQVYRLWRRGAKSPVRSEVVSVRDGVSEIALLDLATHVMALYKFPPPNLGEEMESYEVRCRLIARMRCDRAANQLAVECERSRS